MFPFKSVSEFNSAMRNHTREITTRHLLAEAKQVAAWGVPSNESTGYSQRELCSMIYQLIDKIEEQESIINLHK